MGNKNEKIRTEDVVEILDGKILTSEAHPALGVVQRENYDSVLNKISLQTLSPAQKEAFDNTLTTPSSTNPVVLKDDLATYIPEVDLGQLKDAVPTFGDLPMPFNRLADTTNGSDTLLNVSSLTGIEAGQTITGAGIPSSNSVIEIFSPSTVRILIDATVTATGVTITFSPTVDDLRPVLADNIIYRWNGSAWLPFIRTGTLDHTELVNQNGDSNFQHLTLTEKNNLISSAHSHANKPILDQILSAGSGQIITTAERNRLPSQNEKDALIGTSGVPSAANPYVTNIDPRLNTVRNPYVTIGPPGSLATFQGVDYRPFEDAILAITIGSATAVKAIEVLPGFYTFGGVVIRWDTPNEALLIENFTPGTATLSFQTFQAGLQALTLPGTGQFIVRGFRFELNDLGTCGILTQRPNSVIEDCVFLPGPTTSINQFGITLEGASSTVRRCRFEGALTKGVEIKAPGCRVEECTFNLTLPSANAVDIFPAGDNAMVDHCHFISGKIRVQAGSLQSMIFENHFTANSSIQDLGEETRILQNQPQDINQPFLGRRRTLGPPNSYADFRGTDQAPFLAALADPNCSIVEILPGTYTFTGQVTVPAGKQIRAYSQNGAVLIQGTNVTPSLFSLSSYSSLQRLALSITGGGSCVTSSSAAGLKISDVSFNVVTAPNATDYGIRLSSAIDGIIDGCSFTGIRSMDTSGSTRMRFFGNKIDCEFVHATGVNDHLDGNIFQNSPAPLFGGQDLIVVNNHFLGPLPSKLQTTGSIWRANWPAPSANNDSGVDTFTLSLGDYGLSPVVSGATATEFIGCGVILFDNNFSGVASSLPILLPGKVNRLLGYSVELTWTSPAATSGDVVWQITATFRDSVGGTIGTSTIHSSISTRSSLVPTDETSTTIAFTNLEYGLTSGIIPTHATILIQRSGTAPADTLSAPAYLLSASITLSRD